MRKHGQPNTYEVRDGVAYLDLCGMQGQVVAVALVDPEDIALILKQGRWSATKTKRTTYVVHKSTNPSGTTYLHRLIMSAPVNTDVDHVNHNGLDCRKQNLNIVDRASNCQNRIAIGRSGSKNVVWVKTKQQWHVRIMVAGKEYSFGYFDDLNEAKEMAKKARKENHSYYKSIGSIE